MPICYFCGKESDDLKKCPHCLENYCPEHYETNNHDCGFVPIQNPFSIQAGPGNQIVTPEELGQEPIPRPSAQYYENNISSFNTNTVIPTSTTTMVKQSEEDYVYTDGTYFWHRKEPDIPEDAFDPKSGVEIPGILWPEKSEVFHVIFASVLLLILVSSGFITQIALSIFIQKPNTMLISDYMDILIEAGVFVDLAWEILVLSGFYLMAFLVHEFSHRQTAKHFNLQTKFRLFRTGVIMTLICFLLPVKFALPGAVVVIGLENIGRETGLCKVAGPLSNLILGSIILLIGLLLPDASNWSSWLLTAATFNFTLGTFNMLPFGILDGDNIRKWKPKLWVILFITLIGFTALTISLQY